jgi:hypothetical protein
MHEGSKSEQRAAAISLTRREAIERVSMLLGGVALVGQSALLGACASTRAPGQDASARSGALFTDADVALLDEIAETILPETSTPGAKAAGVGPFIALMVEDAYGERDQGVFVQGLRAVDEASETMHGVGFMAASAAQRLALLERLDAEQLAYMRSRRPDEPAHYFRMMKELALLGYFTSEIGYTQAMRYVEAPGRFDPCVPHSPGDKLWAPHA